MLELLAQVDPMTLPLWVVLAFSAAMYPLGFMLGAPCSECCGEEENPCQNKCTHHFNNTCYFKDEDGDKFLLSWDMTYGDIAGSSSDSPSDPEPCSLDIGTFISPGILPHNASAKFCVVEISSSVLDPCRCFINFSIDFIVDFSLDQENLSQVFLNTNISMDFTKCSDITQTIEKTGDYWGVVNYNIPNAYLYDVDEYIQDFLDFANSLPLTLTVTLADPCECGACCDNGCEKNVASGGCTDWQGVGVDCDPDPCPQPGACCVNGECYQATEEQCGIDGGAWQAGACEPNPC